MATLHPSTLATHITLPSSFFAFEASLQFHLVCFYKQIKGHKDEFLHLNCNNRINTV
jgi:hypothetical protein